MTRGTGGPSARYDSALNRACEVEFRPLTLEPDEYEIYLEQNEQKITLAVRGEAPPIDAIQSFLTAVEQSYMDRLAKQPGAVTQRGIWSRLKS